MCFFKRENCFISFEKYYLQEMLKNYEINFSFKEQSKRFFLFKLNFVKIMLLVHWTARKIKIKKLRREKLYQSSIESWLEEEEKNLDYVRLKLFYLNFFPLFRWKSYLIFLLFILKKEWKSFRLWNAQDRTKRKKAPQRPNSSALHRDAALISPLLLFH